MSLKRNSLLLLTTVICLISFGKSVPAQMTAPTFSNLTSTSAVVDFTPLSDAVKYHVTLIPTNSPTVLVYPVILTGETISGMARNEIYHVSVKGVDSEGGISPESELVTLHTRRQTQHVDVLFVLDGSHSLNESNFNLVKTWVKNVTRNLRLIHENTSVGVVQYSHYDSSFHINAQKFIRTEIRIGQENNQSSFEAAVDKVKYDGFNTPTGYALRKVVFDFNETENYGRSDNKQVMIIVTDGIANEANKDIIPEAAAHLRRIGVIIYAVGIAGAVRSELKIIANDEKRVKFLQDFYELDGIVDALGAEINSINLGASPRCMKYTNHSHNTAGRTYTFPTPSGNYLTRSTESCANHNYSATIQQCVIKEFGALESSSSYFDITTLKEYSCDLNFTSLLDTVKNTNLTSSELEYILGNISAMSSIRTTQNVKNIIAVLEVLQQRTKDNDIIVTEDTLVSLLWVTDDIHDTVQSEVGLGSRILSRDEQVSFLKTLEVFASNLALTNDVPFTVKSSSNLFEAQKLNCSSSSPEIMFNGTITDKTEVFQEFVQCWIPSSVITNNCNESKNTVFHLYSDITLFPIPAKDTAIINMVLSAQISKTPLRNLKEPITQSFGQPQRGPGAKRDFVSHRCAYLDLSAGEWKYDGCKTIVVESGTTCECDHTTNFAVLVRTHAVKSSNAINIVGYIGCSCSTVGLILLLVIYLSFKQLRTNQFNQIHIHLSICLLVAYLTFLTGVERPRAYVPCMAVGAILQFSFLSSWGWMFAECVTMYKNFMNVFYVMSSRYVIKMSAMVYISSLIATGSTIMLAYFIGDSVEYMDWISAPDNDPLFHPSYYVSDQLCWLHGYSLYFGFLTPVAFMFVANIFGFVRIIRVITKPTNAELRSSKVKKNELKDHASRILTVSVLLGIMWAFAIPLTITDDVTVNEIFGWMFTFGNSFQGVLIFLMFCVKRGDVRNMWLSCLPGQRSPKSSTANSNSLDTLSVPGDATGTVSNTSKSNTVIEG